MMMSACTRPGGLFIVVASFGERLKLEREKRGMTLEEVSGVTKISVRNLRALEQEKFEQMPGGIFNRGFVRAYAKHLGLDEDQVVADYMDAAGESVPEPTAPDAGPGVPVETRPERDPQVPWTALVSLLILGAVLLAAWSYWSSHKTAASTPPTGRESSGVPAPAAAAPNPPQPSTSPELVVPAGKGVPRDTLSAGSLQAKPRYPNPPVQAASRGSSEPDAAQVISGSGFNLSLRARDEVWLLSTVDDQAPSEATMVDGQSVNLHAANRITVKVGNLGGLEFALNGRRVPVGGSDGEVRTLTFTARGLQKPAPNPN